MNSASKKHKALVVEDNEFFRKFIIKLLAPYFHVQEASTEQDAKFYLEENYYALVVIDINLHGKDCGFNILKTAKEKQMFSIILTDHSDESYIKKAYKIGCDHFLTKDQTEYVLKFIAKDRSEKVSREFTPCFFQEEYITKSIPLINEIKALKYRISSNRPLLIVGEAGTGKKKLAELIHLMDFLSLDNFVTLDCAIVSCELIESKLFELHNSPEIGTFFIANINHMPVLMQKNFIQYLNKENSLRPIISCCDDIQRFIHDGLFDLSLYNKLSGISLRIPPLRERLNDIPALTKYFVEKLFLPIKISNQAMSVLTEYLWPGNITELVDVLKQLSSRNQPHIDFEHLPIHVRSSKSFANIKNVKSILTEEHMAIVRKVGLSGLIERIEVELAYKLYTENEMIPYKVYKQLNISRTKYYAIMKKVQDLYKLEKIEI
ncbi:MAG: sigma-54-dependent Fis family transcriptional regulator [Oligoflexia bacterium]|nr:sigma-54-dependent Fis family transcriptional regulator [Oligoflexia bacterium]